MDRMGRQQELPKAFSYLDNAQSPEEVLYSFFSDYLNGNLNQNDFSEAGVFINQFPPFQHIHDHKQDLSIEKIRLAMGTVGSPAEFAGTNLFKSIMNDEAVIARFQAAAQHIGNIPAYWPQEYRNQRQQSAPNTSLVLRRETMLPGERLRERIGDWRNRMRALFGKLWGGRS